MSADSVAAASVASIGNNNSLYALLAFFALMLFFCMVGSFFLICALIWFSFGGSDSSSGERERSSSWWYSWRFWIPGNSYSSVNLENKDIAKDESKATNDSVSGKEEIAALKKEIDALKNVYDDRVSTLESKLTNVEGQNIFSLQNSVLELFKSMEGMKHSFKCSNGEISSCKKVILDLTSRIKVIETYLGENFHNKTNKDFVTKYGREATIDDYDLSERVLLIYHQLQEIYNKLQEKKENK